MNELNRGTEATRRQWLDGRSDRSDCRCGRGRHHSAHNPRRHPTNPSAGDVDHLHTGDAATIYKDYPSGDDYYIRSAATIDYNDRGTVRSHSFWLPIPTYREESGDLTDVASTGGYA